jgi:type IV pilus assembly protein PilP
MTSMKRLAGAALLLGAGALLGGCGSGEEQELSAWMEEVKRTSVPRVAPLKEPKTFIPVGYSSQEEMDPFDQNKLLGELQRAAQTSANPLRPDTTRRKEPLEGFPLDTMRMVGTIQKNGTTYGLVQIDRLLHQVKTGQRLGPDYGVITAITDQVVTIKETVQDPSGEWVERSSRLELQESKETKK